MGCPVSLVWRDGLAGSIARICVMMAGIALLVAGHRP